MAKCPHCEAMITNFKIQEMTSSVFMGTKLSTIAYVCPECHKIISAQIDPIAINADMVNKINRS